jgi:hypothetical protein
LHGSARTTVLGEEIIYQGTEKHTMDTQTETENHAMDTQTETEKHTMDTNKYGRKRNGVDKTSVSFSKMPSLD